MGSSLRMLRVIDSHTAGQPTRVIIEGGPHVGEGSLVERRERLRKNFDRFRSAVVGEPRGSDALVGALLCTPCDPTCASGAIFFDNAGYLGMCGHGMIGFVATLEYLGMLKGSGPHRIETPVGVVTAQLHPSGEISIDNVASFRHKKNVTVTLDGTTYGGDIAFGGNWFFLVNQHREELTVYRAKRLTELARAIRQALAQQGITGANGESIDTVGFFAPPHRADARSRNFVLTSGKTYDRSPCGTGTSAKLACLFEDGLIKEGESWRQESIVGTVFDGSVRIVDGAIRPTIRGAAYVTADSTLIVDERDPLCWGLR